MSGTQKLRSKVNVVLNRVVREGVISGFKTNFGNLGEADSPHVTVAVAEGQSLEEVRALVMDAVMGVVGGIDVTAARHERT